MSDNAELQALLRQRADDHWMETEQDLGDAMDEIARLQVKNEYLQRRCEVYASGMFAIAVPIDGQTADDLSRIAQNTLDRLHRMEQDKVAS